MHVRAAAASECPQQVHQHNSTARVGWPYLLVEGHRLVPCVADHTKSMLWRWILSLQQQRMRHTLVCASGTPVLLLLAWLQAVSCRWVAQHTGDPTNIMLPVTCACVVVNPAAAAETEKVDGRAVRRSLNATGRYVRQPTKDEKSQELMEEHGAQHISASPQQLS